MSDPRCLRAALYYAGLGWRVLALAPGDKAPIVGRDWPRRATTDETTIRAWWRSTPTANVGILCDRIAVLDIEAHGIEPLRDWMTEHGLTLPEGPLVATGRGGFHAYYQSSTMRKADLLIGAHRLGELRTGNHQCAAPPSRTVDEYRWLVRPTEPLPVLPGWVRGLLPADHARPAPIVVTDFPASVGARKLDALAQRVAASAEGERNGILFWAARRAAKEGHPVDVVADVLLRAALSTGLREHAARGTIRSGFAWADRPYQS